MEKEILEKQYNEGLLIASQNVENEYWSTLYAELVRSKADNPEVLQEAYKAGLQDGYHFDGQSHFEEWFRFDYSGRTLL